MIKEAAPIKKIVNIVMAGRNLNTIPSSTKLNHALKSIAPRNKVSAPSITMNKRKGTPVKIVEYENNVQTNHGTSKNQNM